MLAVVYIDIGIKELTGYDFIRSFEVKLNASVWAVPHFKKLVKGAN